MDQTMVAQGADAGRNTGTWVGFLAAAFCVVGMMGLFATYAAPLAYQREIQRDAVLDRALASPADHLPTLRDQLGDSAAAVLSGPGTLNQRIATERAQMRVRFAAEADATAQRLRLLVVMITFMGALFGSLMLGLQRRG